MKPIPYNHPFRVIWNLSVLTAILFFFINTFYRIVFDSFSVDAIYVGAVCVFIVDAALNFFTTVKIGHIKYESFAEIRGRYLKKDFYIDLFSAAPIEYVLLAAGAGIQPDSPAQTAMLALHALSLVKPARFRAFSVNSAKRYRFSPRSGVLSTSRTGSL